jgi:tRNA (adenine-N(1)-)-methyltransferase non-catalytic subunit
LIASPYDLISIIDALLPYLAGSSNLVVHSLFVEPLVALQHHLKESLGWIAISITEAVLRKYQVLPGRTHPEMQGIGPAGFLLHAIHVIDTETETLPRHPKRRKTAKATQAAAVTTPAPAVEAGAPKPAPDATEAATVPLGTVMEVREEEASIAKAIQEDLVEEPAS